MERWEWWWSLCWGTCLWSEPCPSFSSRNQWVPWPLTSSFLVRCASWVSPLKSGFVVFFKSDFHLDLLVLYLLIFIQILAYKKLEFGLLTYINVVDNVYSFDHPALKHWHVLCGFTWLWFCLYCTVVPNHIVFFHFSLPQHCSVLYQCIPSLWLLSSFLCPSTFYLPHSGFDTGTKKTSQNSDVKSFHLLYKMCFQSEIKKLVVLCEPNRSLCG